MQIHFHLYVLFLYEETSRTYNLQFIHSGSFQLREGKHHQAGQSQLQRIKKLFSVPFRRPLSLCPFLRTCKMTEKHHFSNLK